MDRRGSASAVAAVGQLCSPQCQGWDTELLRLTWPCPPSRSTVCWRLDGFLLFFGALGQRARVQKAPDGPCLGLCWDQPSHTLPPAQRSTCHGRVARADMTTSGAQDSLRPQYPLLLADSLFTTRLPLHVLVLEEPRHRPVCTAQARGRCWDVAKQRIGTHV